MGGKEEALVGVSRMKTSVKMPSSGPARACPKRAWYRTAGPPVAVFAGRGLPVELAPDESTIGPVLRVFQFWGEYPKGSIPSTSLRTRPE
jgi:hypothetical protein